MYNSINRMDGTSIDWSHINGQKKQVATSQDVQLLGSSAQMNHNAESKLTQQDKDKLYKEVEKVNESLKFQMHNLRFKFSEEADQFYVEVLDSRTQEVIDSIPGKHMIELAAKLKDMIGFFIDEKR